MLFNVILILICTLQSTDYLVHEKQISKKLYTPSSIVKEIFQTK